MSVGRGGNPLDQLAQQVRTMLGGVSITPGISYDAQILAQRVADAVAQAQVTPVNAAISFKNGAYVVSPASAGQSVDGAEAVRQAIAALNTDSTADTSVAVAAVDVSAQITTPDAQAAVDRARAVTDQPLTIALGSRTEVIDALTLRGWVRLEETAPGSWDLMIAREPINQLVGVYRSRQTSRRWRPPPSTTTRPWRCRARSVTASTPAPDQTRSTRRWRRAATATPSTASAFRSPPSNRTSQRGCPGARQPRQAAGRVDHALRSELAQR